MSLKLANEFLSGLRACAAHGLPDCYESVWEALGDIVADLPWGADGERALAAVREDVQAMGIVHAFDARFGINTLAAMAEDGAVEP